MWAPSRRCGVGGIVVSIAAFQAVDPGSIPGQRSVPTFCQDPGPSGDLSGISELVARLRWRPKGKQRQTFSGWDERQENRQGQGSLVREVARGLPAQRQRQGATGRAGTDRRAAPNASLLGPGDASGWPGAGGGQAGRAGGVAATLAREAVRPCGAVWLQESVSGAVEPTLPGGLVVRIRRSHRRGPGSIPGQGSLSSSSLHLHFPPRSSHQRSLLPNTHPHTNKPHNYTRQAPLRASAYAPTTPTRTHTLKQTHAINLFCLTASLSASCPSFSHITTPAQRLCSHPPTLHLSRPASLLILEPRFHIRPHHRPTFLTRAWITNTRPLMEPQQDSISSSPALGSPTNHLASPPDLPRMDHLHHTHSTPRMNLMLPVSFPEYSFTNEHPFQTSVADSFI